MFLHPPKLLPALTNAQGKVFRAPKKEFCADEDTKYQWNDDHGLDDNYDRAYLTWRRTSTLFKSRAKFGTIGLWWRHWKREPWATCSKISCNVLLGPEVVAIRRRILGCRRPLSTSNSFVKSPPVPHSVLREILVLFHLAGRRAVRPPANVSSGARWSTCTSLGGTQGITNVISTCLVSTLCWNSEMIVFLKLKFHSHWFLVHVKLKHIVYAESWFQWTDNEHIYHFMILVH